MDGLDACCDCGGDCCDCGDCCGPGDGGNSDCCTGFALGWCAADCCSGCVDCPTSDKSKQRFPWGCFTILAIAALFITVGFVTCHKKKEEPPKKEKVAQVEKEEKKPEEKSKLQTLKKVIHAWTE